MARLPAEHLTPIVPDIAADAESSDAERRDEVRGLGAGREARAGGVDFDAIATPEPTIESPPVQSPPVQGLPLRLAQVSVASVTAVAVAPTTHTGNDGKSIWHRARAALGSPFFTSLVVHAWLLLILAWWTIAGPVGVWSPSLVVTIDEPEAAPEVGNLAGNLASAIGAPTSVAAAQPTFDTPPDETPTIRLQANQQATVGHRADAGLPLASSAGASKLLVPAGISGGGWHGRGAAARGKLLADRGGTPESERGVERGLRWLAAHQLENGSWSFNHQKCPQCGDLCRHPGNVPTTTGATALALLPFLGAGITHLEGEHHEAVQRGIYYLGERMIVSKDGGDVQDGTMYAQGLATIALCEAYAMSGDDNLRPFAQAACDFIVHAQHQGGGWRYLPGQPGDTTVFGWQLMALKSGQMAGLQIPPATWYSAARFLDQVQSDGGAAYGYQAPDRNPTMTSIGLLSRMYLGWPRQQAALQRGADYLAELGPSENNLYFNYYATQVLQHLDDARWPAWNEKLREHLLRTQAVDGHESGSWYFEDSHTKTGGRLYNTAVATMILEVYYRYLPLYTRQVLTGGEFNVP